MYLYKLNEYNDSMVENESELTSKQSRWNELTQYYTEVHGDKLGKGLDQLTIEPVVGLNVLGYTTSGSCEGHPDMGSGGPYLDVHSREAELFASKFDQFWAKAGLVDTNEQFSNNLSSTEQLDEFDKLHIEQDRVVSKLLKPIQLLLDEFHRFYPSIDGSQLACEVGPEWIRIQPADVESQNYRSIEEQREYLEKYQAELKAFGEFLKALYFSKATHCSTLA